METVRTKNDELKADVKLRSWILQEHFRFVFSPSAALRGTCAIWTWLNLYRLRCCLCRVHQKWISQCLRERCAVVNIEKLYTYIYTHTLSLCIAIKFIYVYVRLHIYMLRQNKIRQDKIALWLWDTGEQFPVAMWRDSLVPKGKFFL